VSLSLSGIDPPFFRAANRSIFHILSSSYSIWILRSNLKNPILKIPCFHKGFYESNGGDAGAPRSPPRAGSLAKNAKFNWHFLNTRFSPRHHS
jgi:hypothetical protein